MAAGVRVTQGGVDLWVPAEPFRGDMGSLEKGPWETLPPDRLPHETQGNPVLASANLLAAVDGEKRAVALYTRQGARLTRRGEAALDAGQPFGRYRLVRDAKSARPGVEILSADNRPICTLFLSADGILEFRPGEAKDLAIRGARLKYGIVPSLVGTDFVYTAATAPGSDRLYVPSMNLLVGLVEGGDCAMVGVWPPGQQVASLHMAGAADRRSIDGFSLQTAGRSFYLALSEKPDFWRAEPLNPDYLEKDTAIGWKRPFEARWIGRFFVVSEGVHYPFYFRHERVQLWGRCIRGWFYWPVRFDGDRTMIHFEKRFPPQGELLIYHLEKDPERPADAFPLSPVEVAEKALGVREAARLLDFAGIEQRPLLEHGYAVCEMTAALQKHFDVGEEVKRQAEIAQYAGDVVTFIRLVRGRIHEFRDFAAQTKEFLRARAAAEPKLADAARQLLAAIDEFQEVYKSGMPATSLEEVRQWTEEFKSLAREVRPGNNKKFDAVAEKCRTVAGGQDDLVRDLNVLAIRLTEKAAEQAVRSPEHARLAEEIIARSRRVLRNPTVLEPRRHPALQADPGTLD